MVTRGGEEIQRMMNVFWRGSGLERGRGIWWLEWDKLCIHKNKGGMGLGIYMCSILLFWETMLEITVNSN